MSAQIKQGLWYYFSINRNINCTDLKLKLDSAKVSWIGIKNLCAFSTFCTNVVHILFLSLTQSDWCYFSDYSSYRSQYWTVTWRRYGWVRTRHNPCSNSRQISMRIPTRKLSRVSYFHNKLINQSPWVMQLKLRLNGIFKAGPNWQTQKTQSGEI